MDIKKALAEINDLEMKKARLEVEVRQLDERAEALAKRMAELGTSSETIYAEIGKLEKSIEERLEAAKDASRPKSKLSAEKAGDKAESWMR